MDGEEVFSNIFISIYVYGFRADRYEYRWKYVQRDLTGLYILPKGLSTVFCVQEKF
jgi:hypothetical protein